MSRYDERFDFDTAKRKTMNRTTTAASRGNQQSIVNASAPKDRPILFSAPMVRAILDGSKTQTRRIVKPQPDAIHDGKPYWNVGGFRTSWIGRTEPNWGNNPLMCPYGNVGDRLWVRESHALLTMMDGAEVCAYRASCEDSTFDYANEFTGNVHCIQVERWRPSIHMPRKASRITLELTAVRVERLGDISEEDARAEGAIDQEAIDEGYSAVGFFNSLWLGINGDFNRDQWVWVVEFKRV